FAATPSSITRAPCRGSPSLRSSSINETRGSARTFLVWTASREISSSGAPLVAVAMLTNEQYGSPVFAIRVASAPERVSRISFLTVALGSKSAVGCIYRHQAGRAPLHLDRHPTASLWAGTAIGGARNIYPAGSPSF